MKTSPYIPFYPADFLVGTMFMTAEEVGAYMRLLCFQWQQGGLPQEEDKLARISGIPTKKLSAVLAKFDLHEDGTLKNGRMEQERLKVEATRETKSKNGAKGGRPLKQRESDSKATENLPLSDSLANQKQSETETETESKPNTPPNPQGGMDSGDRLFADNPSPQPVRHSKTWNPTEQQIQVAAWFNRRPSTVWSEKEQKAWRALKLEDEDLEILSWFYAESSYPYLRKDLLTLLNNWRGEVDRARNYNPEEGRR
ncbi:Uncharacterized conserved protein YdaU, DUF1376 family [Prosthecobacter debontii]|uniref:Uncharacterized conserved protein YdaU, DUF1376 family n=1 Tax=Prosthecobacter debontii TaxID=48467 RepID=A0A1T4X5D2_9BACT|nr:YdaU family protein [Prosthecobacter debontii]SKA84647.1 Uncharacterized conserved protein YdaU, DUF1376 family [Prosthecobacter debontii]